MHIIRAIHKKKLNGITLDLGYKTEVMKKCLDLLSKHIKGKL